MTLGGTIVPPTPSLSDYFWRRAMSKIIVRNSCIIIDDYKLGDCQRLEYNFRVWDPVSHSYRYFGMFYDEENRKLYIPRGLDIWKIQKYLGEDRYYPESCDHYLATKNIRLKYKPRDEDQKQALRFMVGVNEYAANKNEPQLSVNLNTGKGKTYCSIATIGFLQIKAIVIAASQTLLTQWKENIKEYTNLVDKDIVWLDTNLMTMVRHGNSERAKNGSIFLCTHSGLLFYAKQFGWEMVREVFQKLGIGIKIFDEAHTNFENMLMIDFFTNVYKTYYVTATPNRSDFRQDQIYQLSIKNIPGIDLFHVESDPHTNYIAIKFNSKPSAQQISMCRNMYGLDRNKYISYLIKQPNFWSAMRIIMDLVIKCNGRVLMYIGTNEGILKVYQWIGTNYPEFLGDIGIFTSLLDKKSKMTEKGKKILLSTTKSAGLGEHLEKLKMTVVVAEPFRSGVLAKQTLGRTRDDDTTYIELVDLGFRKIRDWYYYKLGIFNTYALSVSDTSIDQYELDRRAMVLKQEREQQYPGWMRCPIHLRDERFFEYPEEEKLPKEPVWIAPINVT